MKDNNKIKDWYVAEWPSEELGKYIDPKITFDELWRRMKHGGDYCTLIGIGDSLIREHIFSEMAKRVGVTYGIIYDQWICNSTNDQPRLKRSGTFADIIREWVGRSYGSQEMEDPSWNIEALAEHLRNSDIDTGELNTETKMATHSAMEQAYLEEDVRNYAENGGIDLSEKQVRSVATEVRFSDWYCSIDPECISHYINEELEKEKQQC